MPRSRIALIIGIDDYPYFQAKPLKGCRNDARRIGRLLEDRFDFEIMTLLDEQATQRNILAAWLSIQRRMEAGDSLVMHFSGHGSWCKTHLGEWVTTLVPHDSGRGANPNRDIPGFNCVRWLEEMARITPDVTLFFDSCFSGGLTWSPNPRRPANAGHRAAPPDSRPHHLEIPDSTNAEDGETLRDLRDAASGLPRSDLYTLLTACRANESARETLDPHTELHFGALSLYLSAALTRADEQTTYRDLYEIVASRVNGHFRHQHPGLEGAWDRHLFGATRRRVRRHVVVDGVDGQVIRLRAGAAHGLVPGAEYLVTPREVQDQNPPKQGDDRSARRICIDRVEITAATASPIERADGHPITAGDLAIEARLPPSMAPQRVWISPNVPDRRSLRQRLKASPFLRPTDEPEGARFHIHGLRARKRSRDSSPFPTLGPLPAPTWVVTDESGYVVMPPRTVDPGHHAELIVENLENLSRQRLLRALHNPLPNNPLHRRLQCELLGRDERGDWQLRTPDQGGLTTYQEGELMGLRICHSHSEALFLAVFELGLAGGIEPLYPVRGQAQPLPPDRPLEVGLEEGDELELYIPATLPFDGHFFEGGMESLLILATTCRADLQLLEQDGVRGTPTEDELTTHVHPSPTSSLATWLDLCLRGAPPVRETRKQKSELPDTWITRGQSFRLQRSSRVANGFAHLPPPQSTD